MIVASQLVERVPEGIDWFSEISVVATFYMSACAFPAIFEFFMSRGLRVLL